MKYSWIELAQTRRPAWMLSKMWPNCTRISRNMGNFPKLLSIRWNESSMSWLIWFVYLCLILRIRCFWLQATDLQWNNRRAATIRRHSSLFCGHQQRWHQGWTEFPKGHHRFLDESGASSVCVTAAGANRVTRVLIHRKRARKLRWVFSGSVHTPCYLRCWRLVWLSRPTIKA